MAKAPSSFAGRWRITSMSEWDQEYVDAEVEAFIEFGCDGRGRFQFGYSSGEMDCRTGIREGKPAVEWSWEGNDEMDAASGRGWAVIEGNQIDGFIAIHMGEDSKFVAKKERAARPRAL